MRRSSRKWDTCTSKTLVPHNVHSVGTIQKLWLGLIPSKDRFQEMYWNGRPFFGKWQWVTHNLARTHKRRPWKPFPVGQWERVSAYHPLLFQVSSFLGFIARRTSCCKVVGVRSATQTEGLFIPGLQSAKTPAEGEGEDSRAMCCANVCCSLCSPWLQLLL